MVPLKRFVPEKAQFDLLKGVRGRVRLLQEPDDPPTIILIDEAEHLLRVQVEYHDVVFKFECFGLTWQTASLDQMRNARELAAFDGWDLIKCCFRFEWERPARSGEVPPGWEQIVRGRGRRKDIPNTATISCVSMVGVVFWDRSHEVSVGAIVHDGDDTDETRLYLNSEQVEEFMTRCESSSIDDASAYLDLLDE